MSGFEDFRMPAAPLGGHVEWRTNRSLPRKNSDGVWNWELEMGRW